MRIAHVITLFLPDFVGGATLVCARVAGALRARGHEVHIFCGRPDASAPPYSEQSWQVDGLAVTGVHCAAGYDQTDPRNYRHPEVTPVFERFLDRVRPEVVHFHSIQALGATLLDAAAARRIPIVVTMHDWWWFCMRLFLVDGADFICPLRVTPERCHCAPDYDFPTRRRDVTLALAHAARILTPSRFLAEAVVANGVARSQVEVCPNGIDVPRSRVVRRPGPVRFGYFGGPDNRLKGLPTLLSAAEALGVGGWELVLYGCGPSSGRLARRLVDRVGQTSTIAAAVVDRVRLLPAFAPEHLAAVLGTLDCLVVPSLMRESYSLATREALAVGVPVIASDSGGPGEVVRPASNGLVFAAGDVDDLASQMRRVVLEPDLLERLKEGAATTAIPSVAEQVTQLEEVYDAVVRLPPSVASPAASGPHGAADAKHTPRHVLFVTGIDGAPFRYRVINLQDQLATAGIASTALYFTDPSIPAALAHADLVVVYRVPMSGYVRAWIEEARRRGVPLVFSCDDLVFDPAATPHAALALLPDGHRAGWLGLIERYAATLRACDAFIGATEPLVAAAARAGLPGFVVPNALGDAQLAVAEAAYKRKRRAATSASSAASLRRGNQGLLRIAYASGSLMHDLDFGVVEHALAETLRVFPDVVLRLIGTVRIRSALTPFASRIERLPLLPWQHLWEQLCDVDVNLAPLTWSDPFANAKSAVKYLEAAAVGVPTVASPTAAFREAIRDGVNGLLAGGENEWIVALRNLLTDAGLRRRLGNSARNDAFLHYTPAAQAPSTIDALGRVCELSLPRPPAATPTPPGPISPRLEEPHGPFDDEIGRYDLEPEDALAGTAQLSHDTPSPFLLTARAVGQTFVAAADGLYRIDVRVVAGSGRQPCRLVVHLADRAGGVDVRRVEIESGARADDAWVAAEFAPLPDSAGRSLYCWVEATGAGDAKAVALWCYVQGWGEEVPGGLHLDHRPAPGSLTFRTFARALESPAGAADRAPGAPPS